MGIGEKQGGLFDDGMEPKKEKTDLLSSHINDLDGIFSGESALGYSCGLQHFDKRIFGFFPGMIYIFGARRGGGKTTWNVNLLNGFLANNAGLRVFFASLDITRERVINQIVEQRTGIPLSSARRGECTKSMRQMFIQEVKKIYRDDSLDVLDVRHLRGWKDIMFHVEKNGPYDVLIVDHFQKLTKSGAQDRYSSVEDLANEIHAFAVRNNLVCIVNSQLNKDGARGHEKYSVLSYAPALESNADYIFIPNRDEPECNYASSVLQKHNLTPCNLEVVKGRDYADGETFRFGYHHNTRTIRNV